MEGLACEVILERTLSKDEAAGRIRDCPINGSFAGCKTKGCCCDWLADRNADMLLGNNRMCFEEQLSKQDERVRERSVSWAFGVWRLVFGVVWWGWICCFLCCEIRELLSRLDGPRRSQKAFSGAAPSSSYYMVVGAKENIIPAGVRQCKMCAGAAD